MLLYNYSDLELNFDFSKYKNFDLLAFSAGVFAASVMNFNFDINKRIAVSGNPFLFDEYFGLSKKSQNILQNITEKNADEFAKNYLIQTDAEYKIFRHSNRTLSSCMSEFESLQEIYAEKKPAIKDIYNYAIIGENDTIYNISAQREFYGKRLHVVKNARHNLFFKIKNYEQLLNMEI